MYARVNERVFFLLPTVAVGVDIDGRLFVELAWFNFAVGLGSLEGIGK
jgi:hypothetical protein